jgi:uncharacterized membrane protein
MTTINNVLTLLAILGTGVIAGTFFVFSFAVMSALKALPPNEGMAAMRSINIVIQNPIFLGIFMGTALVSLILAVMAVIDRTTPSSYYILAGAALYVIGSFVLTIVFNVPLNNGLEAGTVAWADYHGPWTLWNHIRTAASLASTCAFALAFAAAR